MDAHLILCVHAFILVTALLSKCKYCLYEESYPEHIIWTFAMSLFTMSRVPLASLNIAFPLRLISICRYAVQNNNTLLLEMWKGSGKHAFMFFLLLVTRAI